MYSIYLQILNHKILMLDSRGWTKTHGHFIQMGGFMLFDGEIASKLGPNKHNIPSMPNTPIFHYCEFY